MTVSTVYDIETIHDEVICRPGSVRVDLLQESFRKMSLHAMASISGTGRMSSYTSQGMHNLTKLLNKYSHRPEIAVDFAPKPSKRSRQPARRAAADALIRDITFLSCRAKLSGKANYVELPDGALDYFYEASWQILRWGQNAADMCKRNGTPGWMCLVPKALHRSYLSGALQWPFPTTGDQ